MHVSMYTSCHETEMSLRDSFNSSDEGSRASKDIGCDLSL